MESCLSESWWLTSWFSQLYVAERTVGEVVNSSVTACLVVHLSVCSHGFILCPAARLQTAFLTKRWLYYLSGCLVDKFYICIVACPNIGDVQFSMTHTYVLGGSQVM